MKTKNEKKPKKRTIDRRERIAMQIDVSGWIITRACSNDVHKATSHNSRRTDEVRIDQREMSLFEDGGKVSLIYLNLRSY
jgi:hypothetical protein